MKILLLIGRLSYRLYFRLRPGQFRNIVGIPYQRDPENPCDGYEPFGHSSKITFRGCETDGHYLCKKCVHREE